MMLLVGSCILLYCVCRALVGMMMYNSETKEIAKPSELLNSIKAIMNVLQSVENYGISCLLCYHHFISRES